MTSLLTMIIAVCGWILTVLITVTGWVINHSLSLKAQDRSRKSQILDRARTEITERLRDYQRWMLAVFEKLVTLENAVGLEAGGHRQDWAARSEGLIQVTGKSPSELAWVFCLEEYEILFPETARVRRELGERHSAMDFSRLYSALTPVLLSPADQSARAGILEAAASLREALMDQIALIEDLRIYIQNVTLYELTGNRVPDRQPKDPSVPRVTMGPTQELMIVSGPGA